MADIRIKDLTTLESASLTGDVFVIDGTTGTRKLSAFSPTFGGDPVVNGTLTLNGTSGPNAVLVNGNGLALNTTGSASIRFLDGPTTSKWWIYKLSGDQNLYIRDMVNSRMQMTFIPGLTSGNAISYLFSNLVVDSSAISTTTATGALVVSGGVGVGGAIVAGGALHTTGNGTGGPYLASSANFDFASGQARFYGRGANTSTRATLGFYSTYSDGTGGITLQTFDTSGNATFAGGLTTGADTSLVAIYVPGDSALRAAAGKLYLDTRTTDGGDIVLRPRTNAALTLAAATGNATFTGTLTANSTITAANTIKYVNSGVSNGTTVGPFQADIGADGTLGPLQVSIGGSPSATGASRFGYVAAGDVGAWRRFIVGSNTTSGGGQVLIPSTDISTSTSSGALVVSGGVGVAGAIYAGGDIAIPADKGLYLKQGNVQKWTSDGTPTGTSRADIYADSGGAFFVRTGGATQALTISSSQNATFAGAIAINNTVTTGVAVASTHKVQISIGGTTYYLLASNV